MARKGNETGIQIYDDVIFFERLGHLVVPCVRQGTSGCRLFYTLCLLQLRGVCIFIVRWLRVLFSQILELKQFLLS